MCVVFFRNQESNVAVEKPNNCSTFSQQIISHNQPVENLFRCSVCTKSFCKEKSLKIHCRMHNRDKSNSCSVCHKLYSCAETLQQHVETHRKQKSYTCLICNKSLRSAYALRNQTQGHTGNRPFSCSICSKTFSVTPELERHIRTHTGEKPYNCSQCTKSFSTGGQLKRHSRTHTGEKPYSCKVCYHLLNQAVWNPIWELTLARNPSTAQYPSSTKSFSDLAQREKQLKSHDRVKSYNCFKCTKAFQSKCDLKIHSREHRDFICSICNQSFCYPSRLKEHTMTHTGERPFNCTVCTKSFIQVGNLNIHFRVHSEEKPHSCSYRRFIVVL